MAPYTANTLAKLEGTKTKIFNSLLSQLKQEVTSKVTYHSQFRRSPLKQGKGEEDIRGHVGP